MDAIVTADLPLPIAVVTLVEHWTGPVQRADFVTDYGEAGQLALKAGLIGHPSLGYADLTPTGRMIRQQTLRLKHVQADGDFNVPAIPEGVLRLVARFTDDGYLNRRSADSKAHIELATALGIVAPTWPPARLALTPKGQVLRQATLWTRPVEGEEEDEDTDVAIVDEAEPEVPTTRRPLSIYKDPAQHRPARISKAEQRYLDLNGLKPKDLRSVAPTSVRGPGNVEATIEKTARVVEARRAAGPKPAHGERRRKLAEDIKRWTTTTR
jgi:hypothetical protein